jgi:chromosome segregation ATPase
MGCETSDRVQAVEELQQVARDLLAHVERLTMIVGRLEDEKRYLADELDYLRRELARYEDGKPPSFDESDDIEEANRRLAGRFGMIEEEIRKLSGQDGSGRDLDDES